MYFNCYVCYLSIYKASKVQKSKNRFMRADVLFAELASDFGGELVVGGGPFREPPTVMQSTVYRSIKLSNTFSLLNFGSLNLFSQQVNVYALGFNSGREEAWDFQSLI